MVALPNEWGALPLDELTAKARSLAVTAAGKETDMQWAVHWNKSGSNMHMHVIFSERTREAAGIYDRDVYLTEDGRVARRKADRAKNADGTYKPPAHRKGDEQGGFSTKDTRYKAQSWLRSVKNDLRLELSRLGAEMEPPDPLSQFHEGKGSNAPLIAEKNALIRVNVKRLKILKNANIDARQTENALNRLKKDLSERRVPVLYSEPHGLLTVKAFDTPAEAAEFAKNIEKEFYDGVAVKVPLELRRLLLRPG
jgi:hypothetical protein